MNPPADKLIFAFSQGVSECDPQRVDLLGGKGASLAEMSRAGFPVPPGFTISAQCCEQIEASDGAWPAALEAQLRDAVGQLEAVTGRTFGQGPRPLLVAVRSGASVSMPGMMDTILNCGLHPGLADALSSSSSSSNSSWFWSAYVDLIRQFAASTAGIKLEIAEDDELPRTARALLSRYRDLTGRDFPTDPWQALRESVNAVFASWNSERARVYRQHHRVRGVRGTAVNVQMMFPSERSGVLFTANPQRPTAGEMLIEASWGLGEAVVSGAVTPDIYVLDSATLQIKEIVAGQRPADEPALSERQILELGAWGQRVERHFGRPSDIEWGWAEGQWAVLQSRAIRGLEAALDAETGRLAEIARLKQLAGSEHVVWVTHNLGETLPTPTPLTWSIVSKFMSGRGGFGQLYRTLGFHPAPAIDDTSVLELIGGRVYADPRRVAQLFFDDVPFVYRAAELRDDASILDGPPRQLDLERADPWLFLRLPRLAWRMWRASRRLQALRAEYLSLAPEVNRFATRVQLLLKTFLEEVEAFDLTSASIPALLLELERRRAFVLGTFAAETLLPGYLGGLAQAAVHTRLTQLMGDELGTQWSERLLVANENITVEQNEQLYRVARGEWPRERFLADFGYRAANEMELSQPRWREDAEAVERLVARFRAFTGPSPLERFRQQADLAHRALHELPEELARWGGATFREELLEQLVAAKTLLPYRELGKFYLLRGYETLRAIIEEFDRRWELDGLAYFLQLDELGQFTDDRARLRPILEERRRRWQSFQKLTWPGVIDSRKLEQLGLPPPQDDATDDTSRWPARPIAGGQATGVARIVFDPREAHDLGEDYVLVCPSTDPGWTPLFVGAKGLIVERGGVLSHGAIVARDFGIPAVVCENATRRIADGALVHVDANRGAVTLLESSTFSAEST